MRFWKIIAAVACFVGGVAHAGPYFASQDGSLIWDKGTGLVWMRCSVGQKWDGEACLGASKKYTVQQIQSELKSINSTNSYGVKEWFVPNIRQLTSLRVCLDGVVKNMVDSIGDGGPNIPRDCFGIADNSTIDSVIFPGTEGEYYVTSSNDGSFGWYINFGTGGLYERGIDYYGLVRLVSQAPVRAELMFSQKLPWLHQKVEENEKRRQAEEAIENESKRKADEIRQRELKVAAERVVAAERAAIAAAIGKGPQQLYLLAGQSQRGKSIEINGRSFGTTELYELIIEKFPTSEFAVKATDQLTAISRNEGLSRAALEGQSRAQQQMENQRENQRAASRQQCEAQKQTCFSGCGQSSYWNGRSYVDNQSWSGCRSRCESISCY